jgi:hypothetical protein
MKSSRLLEKKPIPWASTTAFSRVRAEGEEKSSGFVGILAQTVKRPLSENELGAALSLAF